MKVYVSSEKFLKNRADIVEMMTKLLRSTTPDRSFGTLGNPNLSVVIDGIRCNFWVEWLTRREAVVCYNIDGYLCPSPMYFSRQEVLLASESTTGAERLTSVFVYQVLKTLADKHWEQYGFESLFGGKKVNEQTLEKLNSLFGPNMTVVDEGEVYALSLTRTGDNPITITNRIRKNKDLKFEIQVMWKQGYILGILNSEDTVCIN